MKQRLYTHICIYIDYRPNGIEEFVVEIEREPGYEAKERSISEYSCEEN